MLSLLLVFLSLHLNILPYKVNSMWWKKFGKITFDRRLKVQRGAILTNTAPGAVPAEGKLPQNKRGQKKFCSTKNGVFFSAAICKKDTNFGAARKIFSPCYFVTALMKILFKVHIFWEGNKILWNLHLTFVLCSASPKVRWRFCKILWPSQNLWTLKEDTKKSF